MTVTSAGNNATSEAKLIVKNNMEIVADTFTLTDTLGEEILAVDESNVRYKVTLRLETEDNQKTIIPGLEGIN